LNPTPLRLRASRWLHRQWRQTGWFAVLFAPASLLARALLACRPQAGTGRGAFRAPVPVVVVGNLYVGGTGKTPVVMAVVQALVAQGYQPGVISRGYGVQIDATPRVGQGRLDAHVFGDEPALIALQTGCAVAVHPRRRLAIAALLQARPEIDVIVSDDGLQHQDLARDIEIIVQDERGVGNGLVLPAGPLREPATRLESVDAVVTQIGPDAPQAVPHRAPADQRPLQVVMQLQLQSARHLQTGEVLPLADFVTRCGQEPFAAAAGIGVPERFFRSLRQAGLYPATELALQDHAVIDGTTFAALTERRILVTAKDAVKCQKLNDSRIWAIDAQAGLSVIDFAQWLAQRIGQSRLKPR